MARDTARAGAGNRARGWARRYALQALYQWQKGGQDIARIEAQFLGDLGVHQLMVALEARLATLPAAQAEIAAATETFDDAETAERLRVLRVAAERGARALPGVREGLVDPLAVQGAVVQELAAVPNPPAPAVAAALGLELAIRRLLRQLMQELEARGAYGADMAYLNGLNERELLGRESVTPDAARLNEAVSEVVLADRAMLKADTGYFSTLLRGIPDRLDALNRLLAPWLGRPADQVDPIEKAILWIAAWELTESKDVPWRVAINEAIELAKRFGAEQSHKFVNGVLDKIVQQR